MGHHGQGRKRLARRRSLGQESPWDVPRLEWSSGGCGDVQTPPSGRSEKGRVSGTPRWTREVCGHPRGHGSGTCGPELTSAAATCCPETWSLLAREDGAIDVAQRCICFSLSRYRRAPGQPLGSEQPVTGLACSWGNRTTWAPQVTPRSVAHVLTPAAIEKSWDAPRFSQLLFLTVDQQ